jgi:hypothetical protein
MRRTTSSFLSKVLYFISFRLMEGGELYDRIIKMKRFGEKDAARMIH